MGLVQDILDYIHKNLFVPRKHVSIYIKKMSSHEIHVIILNVIIFITTKIELCLGTSAGRKETQSYRILQMAWLFNAFRWHINRCLSSVPVIRKESFEYVLHKGQYMAWFYSIKGEKLRFFILE